MFVHSVVFSSRDCWENLGLKERWESRATQARQDPEDYQALKVLRVKKAKKGFLALLDRLVSQEREVYQEKKEAQDLLDFLD